ncbi:DUF2634 domain-containing protein [Sporosarcina sp. FSL K6-3508]|uniref:DUF2634 domain-containing protein n=1 Tax=Sporosarcina sp. FSL K6-3508 TaxID=2921557 RepID=UPI003159B0EB
MSLLPKNETELLDEYLERVSGDDAEQPTKTYILDFETGRIRGFVDDLEAVKQFIRKAIITERSKWPIYTDGYGCELPSLLGRDVTDGFLRSEIPRMVREAIEYDDRILSVDNITAHREGDAVFIYADVLSIYGRVRQEVVI